MSKALKILAKTETVERQKEDKGNVAYYAPFIRVSKDKQSVEGIASSEAVDSYGDIVRVTAIEKALPDYMKYANLRSMHSNIAAGVVTDTKIDKTNKIFYITAKVVDKNEWEKVVEEVYKGFSIGGIIEDWEPILVEVEDKDGNKHEVHTGGFEITAIKLIEISLVDRPANPDALISSYKAAKLRKFDTKDGEEEQKESFVPSVVLQPDLTRIGKVLDTNSRPSSMKVLSKQSNPLSILAPRTMSQVTKAQMQTVADDAIKAAVKAAGITDDNLDELKTLSRGEIIEAAKELVADVVDNLAVFVKAEGIEKSDGAEETAEEKSEDDSEEVAEASEDDTTGTEEKTAAVETEVVEEKKEAAAPAVEEKVEKKEEVKVEEKPVEKAAASETSAIVDALKALGDTFAKGQKELVDEVKKSNTETVAEIKKSNKAVSDTVGQIAKKAGASVQQDEEVAEESEESGTKPFSKSDPWGKRIA